jgi:mono/diheme cytochrome c family protein
MNGLKRGFSAVVGHGDTEMSKCRRTASLCSVLAILQVTTGTSAWSDAQSIRRGKAFARTNCSHCHSIDRVSRSPRREAPPFRNLHREYPVETLADVLAEGISVAHPRMPEFQLEPGEVGDFISFLKSLE